MLVPSERLIVVNAAEATNGETPTRRHRFTIAHAVPLGLPRAAGRGGREDELDEYAVGSRAEAMHVVALAHRLTRLATAPRAVRPLRNVALRLLALVPAFRRGLAEQLSAVGHR